MSIFSSEALRKRRIPGDLAGPITLLTPPLRATLAMGFVLVAAGVGWSAMARIPITVNCLLLASQHYQYNPQQGRRQGDLDI